MLSNFESRTFHLVLLCGFVFKCFLVQLSILLILYKDTNKRAKTYQACLNIFHSERKYLRALLKDTRKQYISSLLEYFSQRAKVSSRFTSKIIQLWYMILKMCPLCAFLALGYLSNCKKCEKTENCNFLCGMFRKMYFLCTFVVGTPAWER